MRLRRAAVASGGVGLALLACACGSTGPATTGTSTAPPATTATSTAAPTTTDAPATTSTAAPLPLPSRPVPIPAGTYLTTVFRPQLALTIPEGYALATGETRDALSFTTPDGLLELIRVKGAKVVAPGATTVKDATPAPEDIGAWLTSNTSLSITAKTATTVGTMPAVAIDAAPAGAADAILFVTGRNPQGVPSGWKLHALVAGSGDDAFVVLAIAPADRFASAMTATAPVLASLAPRPGVAPAGEPVTTGNGCSAVQTFPDLGNDHVTTAPPDSSYNSFPPTSGPHDPQWAPWGISTAPFEQFQLVHNLEHGGIVVQYGSAVDPAPLLAWANQDLPGIVVAPFAQLGSRITVTAWTHLMTCTAIDPKALDAFRDAYRFRGPEFFTLDAYASGPAA